ncbi:MAG TPA: hypothetical protein PKH10_07350 [bacterium]|nr:hypothetical protein [bacterium]
MRVNSAIIAALLAATVFLSCEQVISLDRSLSQAEGSADGEKDSTDEGAAGGNPAEDIAEGADSPSGDMYSDSVAASDADNAVPMSDDYMNGDGSEDELATDSATYPDSASSDGTGMSDADTAESNDDDPTAVFSVGDCGCGDSPAYEPICCDGVTTVFNTCFANCINVHTGQCATRTDGPCAAAIDNDDSEVSDDDAVTGTCGCVPTDMNAWCCDGGARYISQCTATCECGGDITPCR